MSCQVAKRALKKTKSELGNRDDRKGTPEKVVGKSHGYIGTFERELSHVTRGKSCDSQSFLGRGERECKFPEMVMFLVCVE